MSIGEKLIGMNCPSGTFENMKKQYFYNFDYHTITRIQQEHLVIELLEKSQINAIAKNTLIPIVDAVYLKIVEAHEYPKLSPSLDEMDIQLSNALSNEKYYKEYSNSQEFSQLFTYAFFKLCRLLFEKNGHNDEKFWLQSQVEYWLEDLLAQVIVNDERFKPLDIIIKTLRETELLHSFYQSLREKIPVRWIDDQSEAWTRVDPKPEGVLETIRSFDRNYFSFLEKKNKNTKEEADYGLILDETRFSDHATLSHDYAFKSAVLLDKRPLLWIKLWNNLQWPLIQDMPFRYIPGIDSFFIIIDNLIDSSLSTEVSKRLAFILLKNYFDASLKISERLRIYEDKESPHLALHQINESVFLEGKKYSKIWSQEKTNNYNRLIETVIKILTIAELGQWVFSYSPKTSGSEYYINLYNSEIGVIKNVFKTHYLKIRSADSDAEMLSDLNLEKFTFLVSVVTEQKRPIPIKSLFESLVTLVESEDFYWDKSFSSKFWPSLKAIGQLLSFSKNAIEKATELIKVFQVYFEGWNVTSNNYKKIEKETFVCCGAILLLEHPHVFSSDQQKTNFFNFILDHIINQIRFNSVNNDNYKLPLQLLSLVVVQIHKKSQGHFEEEIIKYVDDIICVLNVFSVEGYKLKKRSRILLVKRLSSELIFEKRKLLQKGQNAELANLDKMVSNLLPQK
ncbi:MAG: hypothetical protein JST32_04170 [Bacteroidetes bacterium]|nr:hypothetical protein [Bacteroidota bacterium]